MSLKKPVYLGTSGVFDDSRGLFFEVYKKGSVKHLPPFVQDNVSHSNSGVLRGLHAQKKYPQGKLVTVISGHIFDVAVDMKNGEVFTFELSTGQQVYVPPMFLHGFYCPIPSIVLYKTTEVYHKDDEVGVKWDDSTLNIPWPVKRPILSLKDSTWKSFKHFG